MANRLEPGMTLEEAVAALWEGNPGAQTVLINLVNTGNAEVLVVLDDLEIYGSKIWLLFKDIAGQDIINLFALLDAAHRGLGGVTYDAIKQAVENANEGLPFDNFDYDALITELTIG